MDDNSRRLIFGGEPCVTRYKGSRQEEARGREMTAETTMPRIHANLQLVRQLADPSTPTEVACPPGWPPEPGYPHAVAGVLAAFRPRFQAAQQETAAAPGLLDALLELKTERREMMARNCPRFHSLALCGLVLDQGGMEAGDDPRRANGWPSSAWCSPALWMPSGMASGC